MTHSHGLESQFKTFLSNPAFPCVGAKAALGRGGLRIYRARSLTSGWDDLAAVEALIAFAHREARQPSHFASFALLFDGPRTLTEPQFEAALWQRLQSLSDKDAWLGQRRAPRAATDDPASPHFALSFGGQAFFAVGLHPRASRKARRFVAPAIMFNLHSQFAHLRATGRYEKMRATILERDMKLQGSVNPMLARHGTTSEARQYSGRAVGDDWQCPFRDRRPAHDPFADLRLDPARLRDGLPDADGADSADNRRRG